MSQNTTNGHGGLDPIGQDKLDAYERFLQQYYRDEIGRLIQRFPEESRTLEIEWMELFRFGGALEDLPNLATELATHPGQELDLLEEALASVDIGVDASLDGARVSVVPPANDSLTYSVGGTRVDHRGEYVGLAGQVTKRTKAQPKIVEAAFECQRCGTLNRIPQVGSKMQDVHECKGCERQGPFKINYDQSEFVDFQKVRLQQPPEEIGTQEAAKVDVRVRGDLINSVAPGDRATLAGILEFEQASEDSTLFDEYLDCRGVDVADAAFEEIDVAEHRERVEAIASGEEGDPYQLLVDSLAPHIKGHDTTKLALTLQMFGGVSFELPNGSRQRGDIHVALIGDPGGGKSDLLQTVSELTPRSVYVSGKGASAAGMTAAAVQDDFGGDAWTLEAGALVQANRGVACVDEIDKVTEDARSSMHTALEQQQVHVSKAGINATLPAETSLLAAGNPKYGRFERGSPIGDQIDLGPTLLSRFDLIFIVQDKPDEDRDTRIASHAIESQVDGIRYEAGEADAEDLDVTPEVPEEVLRAWIAHAKQTVMPRPADDEVKQALIEKYVSLRLANGDGEDSAVPVTLRKLLGLCRLAQASARVRLSKEVTMEDVDRAYELVRACLEDVGIDPESGEFDVDIVEAGRSTSQRDRIKKVLAVVSELENEHDEADGDGQGAPKSAVLERCASALGIEESKVEATITKLKEQGDVYSLDQGDHYRATPNF
jgi:replicative DNA helicase Mcm